MEGRGLHHCADTPQTTGAIRFPEQLDSPRSRSEQAEHAANGRRLARTIRTQKPKHLAWLDAEAEIREGPALTKLTRKIGRDQCVTCHRAFLRVFVRFSF